LLGKKKRSFPFSHPKLSLVIMALISSGKAPIDEKRERKKEVKREQLLIT
jgi:hypothetical protein